MEKSNFFFSFILNIKTIYFMYWDFYKNQLKGFFLNIKLINIPSFILSIWLCLLSETNKKTTLRQQKKAICNLMLWFFFFKILYKK